MSRKKEHNEHEVLTRRAQREALLFKFTQLSDYEMAVGTGWLILLKIVPFYSAVEGSDTTMLTIAAPLVPKKIFKDSTV